MKKLLIICLVVFLLFSVSACANETSNSPTNTSTIDQVDDSKIELEKMINESRPIVEGFMNAFMSLNLKNMAEHTNAKIDYTQMEYLSLDEYKREMLSEFKVFQSMGLPLEGFSNIVDKVFASYEKYSSYKILNSAIDNEDVIYDVSVEFIRAEEMENIIKEAINKIDTEELEIKVAGALLTAGISGKSLDSIIDSILVPIVESLDLAVTRRIEELKPEKHSVKFVVSKIEDEWLIDNNLSDYASLSKVFERRASVQ